MKKILIIFLIIFLGIVIIGLLYKNKKEISFTANNQIVQNQNNKNSKNQIPKQKDHVPNETDNLKNNDIIIEVQNSINKGINELTSKLKSDNNKSLKNYNEELQILFTKFDISANKELKQEDYFNIATELAKIQPPTLLLELHLELIKTFYSIGYILKEIQNTDDIAKKAILTSYLKILLDKMKLLQ